MGTIARVIVDLALDREFDYRVPAEWRGSARLGMRVLVPFGRKQAYGYIVGWRETSPHGQLKSIASLVGEEPFVEERMIELARWMAAYYCAPLEQAVRAVLPGAVRRQGARFRTRRFVQPLAPAGRPPAEPLRYGPKQAAVLDFFRQHPAGVFLDELTAALGITSAPVKALVRKGRLSLTERAEVRRPLARRTLLRTQPLPLMPEQREALETIRRCTEASESDCAGKRGLPRAVLLYGVTGSGKTEVYLQAIRHVLDRGSGAIVLVPEISLTPQTIDRFLGRFGQRIAVLHSRLSDGERHDEWHRIRRGEADVVIGARSAVFAPVRNLGMIVVDEEHEPGYKQEETPRYNARDVAVMRASLLGCAVVLGSATPSVESWFNAGRGKYRLCRLPRRADHRRMPVMRVVDMRVEAERTGHVCVFSETLLDAIRLRIERREQTILFLNRRGFATALICLKCGFVARCSQCSVACTYHRSDERLRCHICGSCRSVPAACPQCGDRSIRFGGFGTQRVETIVRKCFPAARIQRMDADMTARKDAHEQILGDFRSGNTDILVGTQMIAKGLHFPNVTLVGVVHADLGLHLPDFRAGERTFQLLAQVAGRAGRGDVSGEVIVQTYTPHHPAVQAARRLEYERFCGEEIEFRRELRYPPFSHLVCVALRGTDEQKVAETARAVHAALRSRVTGNVCLVEPGPAPLARAKGRYRYQIFLRSASVRSMTEPIKAVVQSVRPPRGVTLGVDVDALSLL